MNLYVFITHKNNLSKCYDRIKNMIDEDFVIVCGGFIKSRYNDDSKILELNCNDSYVGLPEKIIKTFSFLVSDKRFENYTHFIKLDDDMTIVKKFDKIEGDYLGRCHYGDGSRVWHIGKTGTFWDKIAYTGPFKPWCMGGFGYIVSRNAIEKIVPNHDYTNHIYEDVYIGILMNSIGVNPIKIDTKKYMISPDH